MSHAIAPVVTASPVTSFHSRRVNTAHWATRLCIAVVVPMYRVESQIEAVISTLPSFVRYAIAVDDCSPDDSAKVVQRVARDDKRVILLRHQVNQGVGGAMVTGFRKALELGADVVVKMDGDGQMSPEDLPAIIEPLVTGAADYAKGNRFRDFQALRSMPFVRRIGNIGLSFLSKAATGYWNRFDPTNGYFAVRGEVLAMVPLDQLHRRYFFETSMLSELYLIGAYIADVPMPARYGDEKSSLSIKRVLIEFPFKLSVCFGRRIVLRNFIYDFNMESVYLLAGTPMLVGGVLYGAISWLRYAAIGISAPTGTVVLPTLLIVLGFQLLLAAVNLDINSAPSAPLSSGPLIDSDGA